MKAASSLKLALPFGLAIVTSPIQSASAADYYVDAQRGADENPGTAAAPLKTVEAATKRVKPGDVVNLSGTFVGNSLVRLISGTPQAPITFQSTGQPAVFDGGLPNFRVPGKGEWEPVPGGAPDEYQSVATLPPTTGSYRGQFLDTHIRLLSYSKLEDFRSTNQTWGMLDAGDPRQGPPLIARGKPSPKHYPWCYFGPGIYFDPATNKLHIRLSPTANNIPGKAEYKGERDPNKLALAVTGYEKTAFDVQACKNLVFKNIIIQNGGNWMGRVEGCEDVTFDHVTFYPSTYSVGFGASDKRLKILNCVFDGGMPPWSFRSEFKDNYDYPTADGKRGENDLVRKTSRCLFDMTAVDSEVAYCEFRNAHDVYFSGNHSKFHHNLVENIHDDSLFVSANDNADIEVYQNVFRNGLTGFSFAAGRQGGVRRMFYRNVVDFREPIASFRPDGSPNNDSFRTGAIFKMNDPVGTYCFYQNTFLTGGIGSREAFQVLAQNDKQHSRAVFNNIFLCLNPAISITYMERADQPAKSDGNLWYRPEGKPEDKQPPLFRFWPYEGAPRGGTFATLQEFRNSPLFELTKAAYTPGFESHSVTGDPAFVSLGATAKPTDDYHLAATSLARGAGVELPADYPDPLRPAAGTRPDIGALPYGSGPLRVGVDGRYSWPAAPAPTRMASTAGKTP